MPDTHSCCDPAVDSLAATAPPAQAEPAPPAPRPAGSGAGSYAIAPRVPFAARLAAIRLVLRVDPQAPEPPAEAAL